MQYVPLHEVPCETVIHIEPPAKASDGSRWFTHHHADGMYSLSTLESGGKLHLARNTTVCYDGERYWLE